MYLISIYLLTNDIVYIKLACYKICIAIVEYDTILYLF